MLAELNQTITLPAGFRMRPCTMEDIPELVDLNNASFERLTGQRPYTVEDQKGGWSQPKFDVTNSTQAVVAPNGQIAGYTAVWDTNPIPVKVWVHSRVHPDFEGQGVGTALHIWAEERSRQAIERVDDDLQVVMRTGALSHHTKAIELLENMGMKVARYFLRMTIDLHDNIPEPVLPEGITINSWSEVADTVTLKDIAQTDYDGFRDHYGFTEQPLEELLEDWEHWVATDKAIDRDLWFLPMTDDGQLAGVSLCVTKSQNVDNWGYLDSLAVLPAWRRMGIASALLHHTFRAFRARGYEKVELHVDAESLTGATRVYERAGMYESERSVEYQKVLRPGRDITRK